MCHLKLGPCQVWKVAESWGSSQEVGVQILVLLTVWLWASSNRASLPSASSQCQCPVQKADVNFQRCDMKKDPEHWRAHRRAGKVSAIIITTVTMTQIKVTDTDLCNYLHKFY